VKHFDLLEVDSVEVLKLTIIYLNLVFRQILFLLAWHEQVFVLIPEFTLVLAQLYF
jgi:hypothetical protein